MVNVSPQILLNWVKNDSNNQWFDFLRLNLDAPYFVGKSGVYVIWYTNASESRVIRVGSGNIATRLKEERSNPEITKYAQYGQLKTSWSLLDPQYQNGVEAYLLQAYNPLIGERKPTAQPISVNLI